MILDDFIAVFQERTEHPVSGETEMLGLLDSFDFLDCVLSLEKRHNVRVDLSRGVTTVAGLFKSASTIESTIDL